MTAKEWLWVGVSAFVVAAAGACSSKQQADDDAAAGTGGGSAGSVTAGRAGTNGSGGSGTGGTGTGGSAGTSTPPITSAPAAWSRPDDCGGIGDRCADILGCGSRSSCQLEGNVCIPQLEAGATSLPGRTAETPYCAAYTCMTFEQASCFCTGEAGALYKACSSPSALAGLCVGEDSSCATQGCCDGLTCIDVGSSKRCEKTCSAATDCDTGCCTDRYDVGVTICASEDACTNPCKKRGETCTPGSSTTPNDCCRGSCVQSSVPDFAGCRPSCTTSADCDTGCCMPFSNSSSGFCVDAVYCTCASPGGSCAMSPCCEGSVCAGNTREEGLCYPECSTDADCSTGTCQPLSDGSASICWDGSCTDEGGPCDANLKCCSGLTCTDDGTGASSCLKTCQTDTDCPSGTCTTLASGTKVCEVAGLACVAEGDTCGVGYGDCCEGLCVTNLGALTGTCGNFCTQSSDCASECCASVGSPDGMVCVPAEYCL